MMNNEIPSIIHCCWFGEHDIPPLAKRCISTWHDHLPDSQVHVWSEKEVMAFNIPHVGRLLKKEQWAFACDIVRLELLKRFGGIYLDVDMEAVRDLRPLLNNACFIGRESRGRVTNGAMGAVPNHPFVDACLNRLLTRYDMNREVEYSPETTTRVYSSHYWPDVHVYPTTAFYPYNPYDSDADISQFMYSDVKEDTYLVHHWQKSWRVSIITKARRFIRSLVVPKV